MFTHDVTFLELAQEPLLGDLLPYFLSKRKQGLITSDPHAKLKDEILAAFDVDVILDGFHYVMEQRKRGVEVFRRFYSEEERLADATKDETCLFYLPSKNPIPGHPFMLICPGGGYGVVEAMVEGFPVAKALNEMGINVFSLKYRVGHEGTIPMADADLHAAIRHILDHADEYGVSREYALMGFSAGGHLVCSFGTHNRGYLKADLPKPQMICSCYSAVELPLGEDAERTRIWANFIGNPDATLEALTAFSPIRNMDATFPPTYVWQTLEDVVVSPNNAKMLRDRLSELGIPHKCNLIPHGPHGLGLGTGTEAEGWLSDAVTFWRSLNQEENK
ncbi:MAG: alpha/beta hydrolase [Clostridiales bacterium]|nr:alpha/beta hydrolase [Clostridiales bacterium]